MCKRGPRLTLFFFFFLGRANLEECGNILKLLLVYESSYVQKIIKIKQPSSSVNQLWKLSSYILKELWGFKRSSIMKTNLGLPSLIGKREKSKFQLHQENSLDKIARLGKLTIISSKVKGSNQINHLGNPNICYGVLQTTHRTIPGN